MPLRALPSRALAFLDRVCSWSSGKTEPNLIDASFDFVVTEDPLDFAAVESRRQVETETEVGNGNL